MTVPVTVSVPGTTRAVPARVPSAVSSDGVRQQYVAVGCGRRTYDFPVTENTSRYGGAGRPRHTMLYCGPSADDRARRASTPVRAERPCLPLTRSPGAGR